MDTMILIIGVLFFRCFLLIMKPGIEKGVRGMWVIVCITTIGVNGILLILIEGNRLTTLNQWIAGFSIFYLSFTASKIARDL